MNNLNEQGKSNGILLFAFNSDKIDYLEIAKRACVLIRKQTQIPITIVSNTDVRSHDFDIIKVENKTVKNKRFNHRLQESIEWKNLDRYTAYDLSPYDNTLLLDADYLMFNDSLLKYFNTNNELLLYKNHKYLDTGYVGSMGPHSIPYVYATATFFKKTNRAKQFFSLVETIQKNYDYYVKLYNICTNQYRNDFAFTIANNMLNGYNAGNNYFLGTLYSFEKPIESISQVGTEIVVKNKQKAFVFHNTDLHIHDKLFLLSDSFRNFVYGK